MPESEKQLERAIVELAKLNGWLIYHTRDSRGSVAGFPDLTLVRGIRLLFIELKTEKGKVSKAQQEWLDVLGAVAEEAAGRAEDIDGEWGTGNGERCQTHIEVHVFRPGDWPEIERVLRR